MAGPAGIRRENENQLAIAWLYTREGGRGKGVRDALRKGVDFDITKHEL
jgi:hypothetical protein